MELRWHNFEKLLQHLLWRRVHAVFLQYRAMFLFRCFKCFPSALNIAAASPYERMVYEAASGTRAWAGSSLLWSAKKRQWTAAIIVEVDAPPPTPEFSVDAAAVLKAPEAGCCWQLSGNGWELRIGRGNRVRHLRRRLEAAKEVRRSNPMGSPASNGHGRKRLLLHFSKQSGRWGSTTRCPGHCLPV